MTDRGLTQLETIVAAYRAGAYAAEGDAFATLLLQFPTLQRAVRGSVRALVTEIQQRGAATPEEAALLRRYDEFENIQLEFDWMSLLADFVTSRGQVRAISTAGLLTRNVVAAQLPAAGQTALRSSWRTVAQRDLAHLVGRMGNGDGLGVWRSRVVPQLAAKVEEVLTNGLRAGRPLDELVTQVGDVAAELLNRSLLLARQEIGHAWEEATLATLRENDDAVSGWRWVAQRGDRTCPACLLLDGTEYPLTVRRMGRHVGCRCLAVPIAADGEVATDGESAVEWFARQPSRLQDRALGSTAAGAAYRAGEVALDDFVVTVSNPEWGDRIEHDRSLDRARQRAARRTAR